VRRLLILSLVLLAAALAGAGHAAAATPGPCTAGTLPTGARTLTCIPGTGWNGALVLYAHGYTSSGQALAVRNLALPGGGGSLPDIVQSAGYAFATTSYRRNGLVIPDGVQDLRDLRAAFIAAHGPPRRVFATGVSEGGLVVTLYAEQAPQELAGALATCGPIGDFRRQIAYIGDARVVFDVLFRHILPGDVTGTPQRVRDRWDDVYAPRIRRALRRDPAAARELIRVSGAAIERGAAATTASTVLELMHYSAFATRDVVAALGGLPYDNRRTRYGHGLDRRVQRVRGSRAALARLAAYETTGRPGVPLVVLHTRLDPVVPFAQATGYARKAAAAGTGAPATLIPVGAYGHCAVSAVDVLGAFGRMVTAAG
jgi:pimeloyl-ACP methyl ester carboxylesterase